MTWRDRLSPARVAWLIAAAVIAVLFTLQSMRQVGDGPWGVDGSYYLQVARHVARGDGLLTSVCLYHQGLRTLPTHTNIYPMWPLTLGFAAKVMPLKAAATYVSRLLFLLDLILLFALIRRVAGAIYGWAAILLFGLNVSFLSAGCYPYTEALAFFFTFAALLVYDIARVRGSSALFAVAGFLSACAFMTRSQMLLLIVAVGVAAIWQRTRSANVIAFAAGAAIPILIWSAYLATFVKPFTPRALIAMSSETPGLAPYDQHVVTSSMGAYIIDRLGGLLVMFNPLSPLSFVASFGPAALLVPIAAVHWIVKRKRKTGGQTILSVQQQRTDRIVCPPGLFAIALSGLLMSLMLLEAHNRFFLEWLFGYRHGLPFILLLTPALVYLGDNAGRVLRTITLVAVVASALLCAMKSLTFVTEPAAEWPSPAEKELSAWLAARAPQGIVMTTNAQVMSIASEANFRWAACEQPPADTRKLLTMVRTDFVMIYEREQGCPFIRELPDLLRPVAQFGSAPNRILLLENRARNSVR